MEGAGASIVSHVAELGTREIELATREIDYSDEEPELPREVDAELATREMDSSDEEPELPQILHRIEDYIQRLEGKGEPITSLPRLDDGKFFPNRESLSTIKGWRSQVRTRLLEAIGNCNTLEILQLHKICGYEISRLTASEWEVVLRGFISSTVLREIQLDWMDYRGESSDTEGYTEVESSGTEWESLCLQLGRILSTSSVTHLTIDCCRLSARCFLNLASGLRGSSDSKLQYVRLNNACGDLSGVKRVADMVNSAPRLETFILCVSRYDMDEETVGIVSQALIQSSSLRAIGLDDGNWGAALLQKVLAGDDGNRSIQRLELLGTRGMDRLGMDRIGDCMRELLTCKTSLKEVTLNHLEMRPEEWHQLGKVIRDNAIATTILVKFRLSDSNLRDDFGSIEALAWAASSDVEDPKLELELKISTDHDGWMLSLNLLGSVLRGEIKSLKSLIIVAGDTRTSGTNQDRMGSTLSMNGKSGETSVLKRLQLRVGKEDLLKGVWKDLVRCLRGNTSLTHLDLSKSELYEEAFRDLMGLLQVNLTLEEIDVSGTSWETGGLAAQIEEALKQNRKRAVYMSVFREARLTFGPAKAGRLFLCGSPRAGKTQLRQTLMSVIQGKSWLASTWNRFRTKGIEVEWLASKVHKFATKGIEVEFLQNSEEMQISVWDLAGESIFRTLQNVLFPPTNHFCVFLFVYSPFCKKTSSSSSSSEKPYSCFRTELEEWLSFITSNTKVTRHNLPQVIVVISHKDKARSRSLNWARSIVEELTKRFANFVDLRQEFFHVDARNNKQVIPLKSHIFETFEKLLSDKSPQVPHLCFQLTSLLVKNIKKNISHPLWSSVEFHDFCAPSLTQHIPLSSFHPIDYSRIMDSIISYLNEVGSIIYIPNLDFIIVDPNWLTNTFLGELIALAQHFQAKDSESADNTMSSEPYTSKDGFVSERVFAGLMEEFLKRHPHGQGIVDEKVLEDILINLDLCFKVEYPSQYFIPSFIPEHASTEEQKIQELAWKTRDETSQFFGIRIQCQDGRRMPLTAAFFPCFQMFMRRKLISELHVSEKNVICSRHYLRLFHDGYEIYVEQGTSHNYVDVMMLRSKRKSRLEALQYVIKHIVEELKSFCASSKGCPGVTLVLSVIQTHCVKMLIPNHLRGVVLIEELKSNFICSIKDKLEDIAPDRLHLLKEEELFNYEHSWPSIKGHTSEKSERARDLLPESDVEVVVNESGVEAVLNEIRKKCDQQLKSFRQDFISVSNDSDQPYTESENRIGNSSYSDRLDRSTSITVDERLRSVEGGVQRVEGVLQRVEMMMRQIVTSIKNSSQG